MRLLKYSLDIVFLPVFTSQRGSSKALIFLIYNYLINYGIGFVIHCNYLTAKQLTGTGGVIFITLAGTLSTQGLIIILCSSCLAWRELYDLEVEKLSLHIISSGVGR